MTTALLHPCAICGCDIAQHQPAEMVRLPWHKEPAQARAECMGCPFTEAARHEYQAHAKAEADVKCARSSVWSAEANAREGLPT